MEGEDSTSLPGTRVDGPNKNRVLKICSFVPRWRCLLLYFFLKKVRLFLKNDLTPRDSVCPVLGLSLA